MLDSEEIKVNVVSFSEQGKSPANVKLKFSRIFVKVGLVVVWEALRFLTFNSKSLYEFRYWENKLVVLIFAKALQLAFRLE